MKKHIETLSDWIESLEVRGYYTFTKEDIEKQFPSAGKVYIKTALYRLAAKAKIVSPWRNFYVIMPVEYSLKGVVLSWEKILCCSFECGFILWRVTSKSTDIFPHGGTTEHEEYFKERNIHIVLFQEGNKYGICKEAQDADRLHQCFLS